MNTFPQTDFINRESGALVSHARPGNQQEFVALAEPHRRELQVHCYRMLGSLQDAEDLVQETLLRAWQKLDTFEGRATFRAWLYKIATNVCLDALDRRPKRTLPPLTHPPADPAQPLAPPILDPIWLDPLPDEWLASDQEEPEARYDARESITLAFLSALQVLPARQRAVLILRDVLDWSAQESAQLLDLTISAVNSALHRARVSMAKHYSAQGLDALHSTTEDETTRALLDRYVHAWEAADVAELVALLKEDATFPMPPSPSWYFGREAIGLFVARNIFAGDARGRWRAIPTRANGRPAFVMYGQDPVGKVYRAVGVTEVTVAGGQIANITTWMNPEVVKFFNVPVEFEA